MTTPHRRAIGVSLLATMTIWSANVSLYAAPAPAAGSAIIVNGRPLGGTRSFAQQRGDRLFLPVVAIAQALGDRVRVDPSARTATVVRQDGTTTVFNADLNEVREDGAVILSVVSADIVFPPNAADLLLPVEILSVLLDISILWERARGTVRITRGETEAESRIGAKRSGAELSKAEYEYNYRKNRASTTQNLIVRSNGRVGDDRVAVMINSSSTPGRGVEPLRRGNVTVDRKNHQKYVAGDFGTGSDLRLIAASARGIQGQIPVGSNVRFDAFAGQAVGQPGPTKAELGTGYDYNTKILGGSVTYSTPAAAIAAGRRPVVLSSGVLHFDGPDRQGQVLGASMRTSSSRVQLGIEVGGGQFRNGTAKKVTGFAGEASLAANLTKTLNANASLSHVDSNFTPPDTISARPAREISGGLSWRPTTWLGATLSSSNVTATDDSDTRSRTLAGSVSLTPGRSWPTLSLSHSDTDGSVVGERSFTFLNATKDFRKWGYFVNSTRTVTSPTDPAKSTVQVGSRLNIKGNRFQVSQQYGDNGRSGTTLDWTSPAMFNRRISVGGGVSYLEDEIRANPRITTRVNMSLRLPFDQRLSITYSEGPFGPTLLINVPSGRLMRKRPAQVTEATTVEDIRAFSGRVAGRVFQDVDQDGRFGTRDLPQAGVRVLLDRNRLAVTDENGEFAFNDVRLGTHAILLDLLSVRADLTLLDLAERQIDVSGDQEVLVDFRIVRTGRLSGRVWLDENRNGRFDTDEKALTDVRVLTGNSRDTLTGENGYFIIGDLPPGDHVLVVDGKTLPRLTEATIPTITIKVTQGRETGNVDFPIVPAAPEVKIFASNLIGGTSR